MPGLVVTCRAWTGGKLGCNGRCMPMYVVLLSLPGYTSLYTLLSYTLSAVGTGVRVWEDSALGSVQERISDQGDFCAEFLFFS